MEELLKVIAKRYDKKGIPFEDLYQEAWVVYLENPKLNTGKLISKLRTRLGRMLRKEYRYNKKENLEILIPENIKTPEELLEKKMGVRRTKDILQTLPLQEYTVVCLVWGMVGLEPMSFAAVSRLVGRSARWVSTVVKRARGVVLKGK